jgi:hypothetical protein
MSIREGTVNIYPEVKEQLQVSWLPTN